MHGYQRAMRLFAPPGCPGCCLRPTCPRPTRRSCIRAAVCSRAPTCPRAAAPRGRSRSGARRSSMAPRWRGSCRTPRWRARSCGRCTFEPTFHKHRGPDAAAACRCTCTDAAQFRSYALYLRADRRSARSAGARLRVSLRALRVRERSPGHRSAHGRPRVPRAGRLVGRRSTTTCTRKKRRSRDFAERRRKLAALY